MPSLLYIDYRAVCKRILIFNKLAISDFFSDRIFRYKIKIKINDRRLILF